jgi:hypothetical protein
MTVAPIIDACHLWQIHRYIVIHLGDRPACRGLRFEHLGYSIARYPLGAVDRLSLIRVSRRPIECELSGLIVVTMV